MNAPQALAETHLADGVPALELLENLTRLHPCVWVGDGQGHLRWLSEALEKRCRDEGLDVDSGLRGLFDKRTDADKLESFRSELLTNGYLPAVSLEIRGRDGAAVPVTATVLMFCTTVRKDPLFVMVGQQPRDREAAREALDPILECAPDAVAALDSRGIFTHVNATFEELLGFQREDLLGLPFATLVADARDLSTFAASLPAGTKAAEHDLVVRTGDNGAIRVMAAASALRGSDATSRGTVLVLRELTARRQGHAELVRKAEELEHCVQALAHDLRSPLVALLGFSRLLRQDYAENLDETGTHFVDRMEQAGRTMERLIQDVLELSRIGRAGEHRMLVDPRIVLLQLNAELKPRLDAEEIRLVLPDHPPMVYCDRTRLYQVFSNLIGNAIEHMGESKDRCIAVEISEAPAQHELSVTDTGCGIPLEHREQIFEAFRSFASHESGRRGTGIGLAIVKKIAETHGGCAWVESEPGEGSRFNVTLSRN
jgi:PAS domain S-box-containing protein